jgi:thiamine monophosphate synthase
MMPARAKVAYKKHLSEPVSIRRITGSGVDRVDASYATVGRIFNTQRKELTGGIAQQDLTAIVYAQDLFDAGLPSDVVIGDLLVDPDGNEHSVYAVAARRVAGVMVAYELTVRA